MALSFYKKKGAMVISYGKKTKQSQQGEYTQTVMNFQFAPVLRENPNGMGYLYDWKDNKITFQFSLNEALKLTENIEIAMKTKIWDKCKVYHKYGESSKSLNISLYKTAFMFNVMSGSTKLNIGMYYEEFKMFKDYVKFAALNELVNDGEYYFQNIDKIQKEKDNNVSEKEPEKEVVDTVDDIDFDDDSF